MRLCALGLVLLVALGLLPGTLPRTAEDPGVGPRSILIGGTVR